MDDSEHESIRLPIELIDVIVFFVSALRDSRWRTLKACSLVSHSWKHLAYRHLFENMCFIVHGATGTGATEPNDLPYFFNIKVKYTSDILRYFSWTYSVRMHIRRLALRMINPEAILLDTFKDILQPLHRLKSLSLHNVVLSRCGGVDQLGSAQRPIFSSISQLLIDQEARFEEGTEWVSALELFSLCNMFEEINHLVLRYIPIAYETQDTDRFVVPPVKAVTVLYCSPDENLYKALYSVPTQTLRILKLNRTLSANIPALSRLLAHIGSNLEHLTLGGLRGDNTRMFVNASQDETTPRLDLTPCTNLQSFGLTVDVLRAQGTQPRPDTVTQTPGPPVPRDAPWRLSLENIRIIRDIRIPSWVKTFDLTVRYSGYRYSEPGVPTTQLWRDLDELLVALVDRGVQTVLVNTGRDESITSCSELEKTKLRELLPILLEKKVLIFA